MSADEGTATAPGTGNRGLNAPTLRKLVKERHGNMFNGGLVYGKIEELQNVLAGTLPPDVLARTLKQRAKARQRATGLVPGRRKAMKIATAPPTKRKYTKRAILMPARIGRKAASPIPPDRASLRASNENIAATLELAYMMSVVPQVITAPDHILRSAVEAILSSRGQP